MANQIDGDFYISGNLSVAGSVSGQVPRSTLNIETNSILGVPLADFRVWDSATQTVLPSAGSSDDLGLVAGAFGTALPTIRTQDMNTAGAVTQYARVQLVVPYEYVSGNSLYLRAYAGMITSVASVSATLDFEVYRAAKSSTLVSGSDICATAAQSINSLTFAALSFTLTPTAAVPGDLLDVRMTIAANSATASSHFAAVSAVELLLTTRG